MIDEPVSRRVIGAAIEVHRALGPGLLESAYQACLAAELRHQGLRFEQQRPLTVHYRGERVDCAYRLDFDIEDELVVELKACEVITAAHGAQVLTYLRLSGRRIGLLLNFHASPLRAGIERFVLGPPQP